MTLYGSYVCREVIYVCRSPILYTLSISHIGSYRHIKTCLLETTKTGISSAMIKSYYTLDYASIHRPLTSGLDHGWTTCDKETDRLKCWFDIQKTNSLSHHLLGQS